MRAIVCRELGPPSLLRVEERSDPTPGPGQAVIAIEAAGVNYVDALFVEGKYQIKPQPPFVPGSEIAGSVLELPLPHATVPSPPDLAIGARVMASIGLGGFAERAVVATSNLFRLPDAMEFPEGATFAQSYSTALYALRDRAGVQAGETVAILGAAGGVGLATIDVARALGATPIAVASTPEKRAAAIGAGAVAAIDPADGTLKDAIRSISGGTGADIVLDPVGGTLAEPALRALGDRGRYVVIGFASGSIPSLPLNQVLLRNRSIVGVDWGAWSLARPRTQRDLLDELLGMVDRDELHPAHPMTRPLAEAGAALEDLLGRRIVGKLSLIP